MERTNAQAKTYRAIDMIATGQRIAELRIEHGYSVSDLQKFFGFEAPQAIYKWQKGQTLPSTDNLYALSDLLKNPSSLEENRLRTLSEISV